MAESKRDSREVLTVKLNLDVSEALTALKAVQREARKTTAAIAELHAVSEASPR